VFAGAGGLAAQVVLGRVVGQAAPGGQVVLPAVHGAGEHGAIDHAEPAEVAAQVRAAALHDPVAELDIFFVVLPAGVPAFGVHDPFRGQALEEGVDVLVVLADAAGTETHAQEQAVDPVDLVVGDQPLDQRAGDGELIAA